jgi:hypothetical protein
MEIADHFPSAKASLELKVEKLQKSYDKLMLSSRNLRKLLASVPPYALSYKCYDGSVGGIGGLTIMVSGPWCKLRITTGYRSTDLKIKSVVFMDKALSSPDEAVKAIALTDATIYSKSGMDSEGVSMFRSMLKHLLEVG